MPPSFGWAVSVSSTPTRRSNRPALENQIRSTPLSSRTHRVTTGRTAKDGRSAVLPVSACGINASYALTSNLLRRARPKSLQQSHHTLPSPKDRLSALIERQHPFPAVFGGDQAIVSLDLERQAVP